MIILPRVLSITNDSIRGFFRLNCSKNVCIMYLGNTNVIPLRNAQKVILFFVRENKNVEAFVRVKQYNNHPLEYVILSMPREEWMRDKVDYEVVIKW